MATKQTGFDKDGVRFRLEAEVEVLGEGLRNLPWYWYVIGACLAFTLVLLMVVAIV